MAQLWLSYRELAELLSVTESEIRDEVMRRGLDRRRCHDGFTRVKLPKDLAERYMREAVLVRLGPTAAIDMLKRFIEANVGPIASEPMRQAV